MTQTFLVLSSAGPNRDLSMRTREQPFWEEHATYIDNAEIGTLEQRHLDAANAIAESVLSVLAASTSSI